MDMPTIGSSCFRMRSKDSPGSGKELIERKPGWGMESPWRASEPRASASRSGLSAICVLRSGAAPARRTGSGCTLEYVSVSSFVHGAPSLTTERRYDRASLNAVLRRVVVDSGRDHGQAAPLYAVDWGPQG
jgi:hypothetical protein